MVSSAAGLRRLAELVAESARAARVVGVRDAAPVGKASPATLA